MKPVNNNFSIKIEGKTYHIYESYILNGTGYTFGIYKSLKLCQRRNNSYVIDFDFNKIVIIGRGYNYMLLRNKKNNFEFDIIKYEKTVLRCYNEKNNSNIYLNDKEIFGFYGEEELFKNDMLICKNINRKEKLIKINE